MKRTQDASVNFPTVIGHPLRYPWIHVARVPKPQACSCGRPVSFDPDKHRFLCIGCGCAKACVCRKSPFTSMVRPVQAA